MLINFDYAAQNIASYSFYYILPVVAIAFIMLSFLLVFLTSALTRSRYSRVKVTRSNTRRELGKNRAGHAASLFLIAAPVVSVIILQPINLVDSITVLWRPMYLSFIAALAACILAIVLSVSLRLAKPNRMDSFNTKSLTMLAVLYGVLLVPPIVQLISGFKWLEVINVDRQLGIIFFWIIGHCMLSLPLLASFLFVTHFRVGNYELDYLRVFRVSELQKIKWSFLMRFRGEYLLAFLLSITIIWNEGIINRVFADYIPSFVSVLMRSVGSRRADYADAMTFLLISIILAFICLLVWIRSVEKTQKQYSL